MRLKVNDAIICSSLNNGKQVLPGLRCRTRRIFHQTRLLRWRRRWNHPLKIFPSWQLSNPALCCNKCVNTRTFKPWHIPHRQRTKERDNSRLIVCRSAAKKVCIVISIFTSEWADVPRLFCTVQCRVSASASESARQSSQLVVDAAAFAGLRQPVEIEELGQLKYNNNKIARMAKTA